MYTNYNTTYTQGIPSYTDVDIFNGRLQNLTIYRVKLYWEKSEFLVKTFKLKTKMLFYNRRK